MAKKVLVEIDSDHEMYPVHYFRIVDDDEVRPYASYYELEEKVVEEWREIWNSFTQMQNDIAKLLGR